MTDKPTPEQRRANIRLALVLGVIALLIAFWPLYIAVEHLK